MNKILIQYLFNNYLKTFLKVFFVFYCFGIILNLFEEIEFFKDAKASFITPLLLTILHIPSYDYSVVAFYYFYYQYEVYY